MSATAAEEEEEEEEEVVVAEKNGTSKSRTKIKMVFKPKPKGTKGQFSLSFSPFLFILDCNTILKCQTIQVMYINLANIQHLNEDPFKF